MSPGPVEWIEIGFPGTKLSPGIVQALKRLVDSGTIRIIDLVVLHKNSDGIVAALEHEGLEPDEAALFADLDGELFFAPGGHGTREQTSTPRSVTRRLSAMCPDLDDLDDGNSSDGQAGGGNSPPPAKPDV